MQMTQNLENIFNRLAEFKKSDLPETPDDMMAVVNQFVTCARSDDAQSIKQLFHKMTKDLSPDVQAEIIYFTAKTSSDAEWSLISDNLTPSYVIIRDEVVSTALKYRDLETLEKIPFPTEHPNFTTRLEKADPEWLAQNLDSAAKALDVDFHDIRFLNTMHRLIDMDRFDVFKVVFENVPKEKRRYHMGLYQAVKSNNAKACEYFLSPETFEHYADIDSNTRYKNIRILIKEAQGTNVEMAMRIFKGLHDHGAIKTQMPLPDLEKMVHLRQKDFLKMYVDLGYSMRGSLALDLAAICARNNEPEMQKLILSTQTGNPFQVFDYSTKEISTAIRRNNLECIKIMHDAGFSTFHQNLIQYCASVEMYEYMTGIGYELPKDRRLMVTDGRPYSYRRLIERQYLYRDLRDDPLTLTAQDEQYLSDLKLSNLRKIHTLPSGVRGRGITLAAKGKRFDIVITAALKHKHNAPFSIQDLYKEDRNLKTRPIDLLIANGQIKTVFEPMVWQNRTNDFETIWRAAIPSEEKGPYEHLYQTCLNALKVEELKPAQTGGPLKRRRRS